MKTNEFSKQAFELTLNQIAENEPQSTYVIGGMPHYEYHTKKIFGQMVRLYDRENFDSLHLAWKAVNGDNSLIDIFAGFNITPVLAEFANKGEKTPRPKRTSEGATAPATVKPVKAETEPKVDTAEIDDKGTPEGGRVYVVKDPLKVAKLLGSKPKGDFEADRKRVEKAYQRTFNAEVYAKALETYTANGK